MYTKINNETYEVSTNLGTAYELEKIFNKKISDIGSEINDFDIKDTIKALYVGFKRKNPDIKEAEFEDMFMNSDDIGIVDLKKEVVVFLRLIMSKNKSEADIRAEMEEQFNKSIEQAETAEKDEKDEKN